MYRCKVTEKETDLVTDMWGSNYVNDYLTTISNFYLKKDEKRKREVKVLEVPVKDAVK